MRPGKLLTFYPPNSPSGSPPIFEFLMLHDEDRPHATLVAALDTWCATVRRHYANAPFELVIRDWPPDPTETIIPLTGLSWVGVETTTALVHLPDATAVQVAAMSDGRSYGDELDYVLESFFRPRGDGSARRGGFAGRGGRRGGGDVRRADSVDAVEEEQQDGFNGLGEMCERLSSDPRRERELLVVELNKCA